MLLTFITFALGGLVAMLVTDSIPSMWRQLRPTPPPAKWQVTISDPDGIPIRSDGVSAEGVARLIKDLNSGFIK